MKSYDTIIVGLGAMGSAAAHACSRRGHRVLGLEQYALVHDQGSSHGHSRIIREAYFEHPGYVPLVREAFARWEELELLSNRWLLRRCPCANIGPPDSTIVEGVQRAAHEHRLRIQQFTAAQFCKEFDQFEIPEPYMAIVEEDAGWLRVEECVRAHLDLASRSGTNLHQQERMISWKSIAGAVEVQTDRDSYSAASLIITSGPWTRQVMADLDLPLSLMRQVQLWVDAGDGSTYRSPRFPIFIIDTLAGAFYGVPADAGPGVKLARHYGAPELQTPEEILRETRNEDIRSVRDFVGSHLPGLRTAQVCASSVCIYTLSPDRHFIIDRHPDYANVFLACGFSGHGFKFAPVVGDRLARMTEGVSGENEWELFRLNRFGV
jgi:sarcosine oxidase